MWAGIKIPTQQTKLRIEQEEERDIGKMATMTSASSNVSEVQETLARIRSHQGVEGVIIMTREGE